MLREIQLPLPVCSVPFGQKRRNMEEDPTPIPSMGMRKSLITDAKGVITGEEVEQDLGHTESGCDVLLVLQTDECSQVDVRLSPSCACLRTRLCPSLVRT